MTTPSGPSIKIECSEFDGTVEKFDEWLFAVAGACTAYNIWDLVEDQLKPSPTIAQSAITDEQKTLLARLYGFVIGKVKGKAATEARKVKEKTLIPLLKQLCTRYDAQGKALRMIALRSLISKRMQEDEDPENFFDEKETLARERLKGKVTMEELLMLATVLNLPERFKAVTIPMLSSAGVTYEQIKKAVLEFYASEKDQQNEEETMQVLKADAEDSAAWKAAVNKEAQKLFNSGAFTKKVCRVLYSKGKGKGKGQGGKWGVRKFVEEKDRTCYKCGKKGHVAKNCQSKKS